MGPLNEYQRRVLDMAQQQRWLAEANAGGARPDFFGYGINFGTVANPLTNGVPFQGVIPIQADGWFLWQSLSVGVAIPNTATFGGPEQITDAGNILLQISLPGTGDDLMNLPPGFPGVIAATAAGSPIAAAAGIPFMFPTPVLIPPNSNVSVFVQKYGTNAGADNPDPIGCYVLLIGAKIPVWQS